MRSGPPRSDPAKHAPASEGGPAVPGPPGPSGGRRLLFTVTTGRSGTEYLARVLALFANVEARHEPKPRFSSCFRAVVAAPEVAREFWEREKLPAIDRGRKPIHAETSHFFGKGFAPSLLDLGRVPDVVHLRRDPRAVARSLWELESIPGRSLRGVRYYLSPWDPNHLPVASDRARGWHDYQLCYWYGLETDARARALGALLAERGGRMHALELESIQSAEGIAALGARLELGPLSAFGAWRVKALASRRVNEKRHQKRSGSLPEERLGEWEAEVRDAAGVSLR